MALEGKLCILREPRPEDAARRAALRNDLDTQAWSKSLPPCFTELMIRKRQDGEEFSFDPDKGSFIITDKETGEFAGYIGYSGLDRRFSTTVGIMMDKAYWGTGMAQDAQGVLLYFSFIELGVRVVRLWTHSGNPRAIGLAEKAGFKVTMRQRESIFKNGKLLDNVLMDILREEYFALHPELEDTLPPI